MMGEKSGMGGLSRLPGGLGLLLGSLCLGLLPRWWGSMLGGCCCLNRLVGVVHGVLRTSQKRLPHHGLGHALVHGAVVALQSSGIRRTSQDAHVGHVNDPREIWHDSPRMRFVPARLRGARVTKTNRAAARGSRPKSDPEREREKDHFLAIGVV